MKFNNNLSLVSPEVPYFIRLFFIVGMLFMLFPCAYGQDNRITIKCDNISLIQVFELIESQSDYTIAYNLTRLDAEKKISLSVQNVEIDEVLHILLRESGWTYNIEEKHIILIPENVSAKKLTQQLRGRVYDKMTNLPLPFASVIIQNEVAKGVLTNEEGIFEFNDLPLGRYDLKVSFIGYEPFVYNEIVLIAGNSPFIEIPLAENLFRLNEVIIIPANKKEQSSNPMILTGGRTLTVEESSRFAGAFDDPARLVTSFAGVSGAVGDNSVIVHGYAPHLLQWKLEGMEIANPNHFADLTTMGGGIFSSLSSYVLGNSDFLTGAYPAEYNNALSGIFDMKLRTGNNLHRQSSVEGSLIGVNIASEGPFKKGKSPSYLFNYRNATFALIKNFIPDMEINNFGYQDLSFKLYFPYKEKSAISIWGIALLDKNYEKFEKYPAEWNPDIYKVEISGNQYMASGGLVHTYEFHHKASLKTNLGVVYTNNHLTPDSLESIKVPNLNLHNRSYQVNASTQLTTKFTPKHTNKSGITWSSTFYNFFYDQSIPESDEVIQNKISGTTGTVSIYSNSLFKLNKRINFNLGINGQIFLLNQNYSIEPRTAINYSLYDNHSLSFAYGLHSRLERLTTYFIKEEDKFLNKHLDFIKSHQFVLSYQWKISDTRTLKIEPYYHYLFNIPMVDGTSYSSLNGLSFLISVPLSNEGKGINKGIDLTFERYLSKGYYYLLTASFYDSKYRGKDTSWFNTRYNYKFLTNILGGKEWIFGRQNQHMISSNVRLTFKGGERYTPINEEASREKLSLVTYEDQMYKKQFAPKVRLDLTMSYLFNRNSLTHEVAFKVLNLTGTTEFYRHTFDLETRSIVKEDMKTILPNLSYKVSF